jgi:hypothetical protein
MDVGLVVGDIGYLAAVFAGLSALALAVQLGEPPVGDQDKKKKKSRSSVDQTSVLEGENQAATFNAEGKIVAGELANPDLSLSDLRKTFVDGFSGPRSKYDIALTILHEINDQSGTTDGGPTMAAEAYLDATHTINLSEQSEPLKQLIASNKKTRAEDAATRGAKGSDKKGAVEQRVQAKPEKKAEPDRPGSKQPTPRRSSSAARRKKTEE